MKGIILAGGLATRLRPLTWVTNKHLLPIYNKPMIYYPIEAMKNAGIKEVLISTSPDHAGDFANLLKDGQEFGLHFYYSIQNNPKGGIANAIGLAEDFVKDEKILVILGDNIFSNNLKNMVTNFEKQDKGAVVYGIRMDNLAKQYGVIELDKNNKVVSIVEKPEHPKSDIAQVGIYMYDNRVFDFIKKLKPSARGELEVTDLNNVYLKEGTLSCELLKWWVDAGTSYDELLRANNLVADKIKKERTLKMDITQLLLNLALTITTIFLVVVGLQLIFVLKSLKTVIKSIKDGKINEKINLSNEHTKDKLTSKKNSTLHTIIGKVRYLSHHEENKAKRFFIKDK